MDEESKRKDALIRIIKFKLDEYLRAQNKNYMNFHGKSAFVENWDSESKEIFEKNFDLQLISRKMHKKLKVESVLFDPANKI